MTVTVPYRLRVALYLLTLLGTPLVAYLAARGVIGGLELALWSAEVTAVTAMAALKATPDPPSQADATLNTAATVPRD